MVNRSIQSKIRKMKRRHRFARFSGASAKSAVRVETAIVHIDDETTKLKEVLIPVGPISLSKQVPAGKGPNPERMNTYYQRLRSFDKIVPETKGLSEPMKELKARYDEIIRDTPREMRIRLIDDAHASLDLFCEVRNFFFVEFNKQKGFVRRSMVYSNRAIAIAMLDNCCITWVEQLPKRITT